MKGFDLITPSWGRPELEKETLRVYDICDGCRRCFNLCPSFNTLFDRIDVHESDTSQLTARDFSKLRGNAITASYVITIVRIRRLMTMRLIFPVS